jgi:hypothetical protein
MIKFEGFDPNTITEFQVYELLDDIPEKYQNLNFDYFYENLSYDVEFMEWFYRRYHSIIGTKKYFKK